MTAGGSDTEVGEAMDDRSITKPPEVLFFNHSPVKLKALSSLCLTCELDGIPEPDIKWFRNGQILFDGRDGYQIRRINFGKWSLFLNQTTKVHKQLAMALIYSKILGQGRRLCDISFKCAWFNNG